MAYTVTSALEVKTRWTASDTQGDNRVNDQNDDSYILELDSGTSTGQVDERFFSTFTISGSSNTTLDLQALTGTLYGKSQSFNFQKIRTFSVYVAEGEDTDSVTVEPGDTNGWTGPFGGASESQTLLGYACFAVGSRVGYTVSASLKTVKFTNNTSNPVDIVLAISGVRS